MFVEAAYSLHSESCACSVVNELQTPTQSACVCVGAELGSLRKRFTANLQQIYSTISMDSQRIFTTFTVDLQHHYNDFYLCAHFLCHSADHLGDATDTNYPNALLFLEVACGVVMKLSSVDIPDAINLF